jgi:hypothetical protein
MGDIRATLPAADKTLLFPNVWLEKQGNKRRVLLAGRICLREGALELFLTGGQQKKEHEAIISADVDAMHVHAALIAAGATAGSTVRFEPKFEPPRGTTIRIWVQYEDKGEIVTVNARDWVKNKNTDKTLETDWVFAGSHLIDNPLDPQQPKTYLANGGDLICVSNFDDAMLDVPIESAKDWAVRQYIAFTERIPPLETKVSVILESLETKPKGR